MSLTRAVIVRLGLAAVLALSLNPVIASTVAASSCVRISTGLFNAPGNEDYAANLNGEWVKIRNYCSTTRRSVAGSS